MKLYVTLSVWARELGRPENERSPTVIRHEPTLGPS